MAYAVHLLVVGDWSGWAASAAPLGVFALILGAAPILLPARVPVGSNECRTKDGRRIWITAFWAARVKKAERFRALVDEQAARYGFDARVAWGYAR